MRLALALLALAAPAAGQSLSSVAPQAAEPGDLVVLRGASLGGTHTVRFTGNVGGFVGIWTVDVAPTSVSPDEVRAIVPEFNNFVGPAAVPPSSPFGTVSVLSGGVAPKIDFYFMEEKHGQVTTPGQGTTLSNGERSVCSFDLLGGEPVSDNPTFTPRLDLAVPGALPVLAVGRQASEPFPSILDGDLVIDLASPIFAQVVGPTVAADGGASVLLPIPKICDSPSGGSEDPVCGVPVALQWGMIDPGTGAFSVSEGMFVTL